MKKVYILAALSLMGQSSWAQIRDFQTTRLNSLGGAGVASVLSTEAAILNPAGAAFFDGSSFSYQKIDTSLRNENSTRKTAPDKFQKNSNSQGVFAADHSGPIKGGISYLSQDENRFERSQLVAHAAVPIGTASSLGFSYRYIQDELPLGAKDRHQLHHQASLGAIHILDEETILGLVVIDPARAIPGDERVIGGFQYNIAEKFMIIGDAGMQYTKSISKKYLWRAGAQINIFSDFFLRAGKFQRNWLGRILDRTALWC